MQSLMTDGARKPARNVSVNEEYEDRLGDTFRFTSTFGEKTPQTRAETYL